MHSFIHVYTSRHIQKVHKLNTNYTHKPQAHAILLHTYRERGRMEREKGRGREREAHLSLNCFSFCFFIWGQDWVYMSELYVIYHCWIHSSSFFISIYFFTVSFLITHPHFQTPLIFDFTTFRDASFSSFVTESLLVKYILVNLANSKKQFSV